MKITIDMENLQSIIEESAKINTQNAVNQAIMDVAHAKVDSVLCGKIEEIVNDSIVGYVNNYLSIGSVDRLRELAQADREGRCVVLPDGGYEDKDGENALKSAMHTCFYHNNPVTRFIADAVAEKLVRNETKMKHCEGMAKNG